MMNIDGGEIYFSIFPQKDTRDLMRSFKLENSLLSNVKKYCTSYLLMHRLLISEKMSQYIFSSRSFWRLSM